MRFFQTTRNTPRGLDEAKRPSSSSNLRTSTLTQVVNTENEEDKGRHQPSGSVDDIIFIRHTNCKVGNHV